MISDLVVIWRAWVLYPMNWIVRGVLVVVTFVDFCQSHISSFVCHSPDPSAIYSPLDILPSSRQPRRPPPQQPDKESAAFHGEYLLIAGDECGGDVVYCV